ncbi:hypothetical protein MOQ72_21185 [Saccharopolyspora sp. K220]|uniref:hypothetical protein n=1 Tax=Saccharopolyspora soli TaxID=2926618 RepID=UPI001F59A128|nr:hypothetical protein [Saccharopolyspora soli]MCI2419965.1 hypothetical protein [Saccharopolyspora soli]
MINSLAGFAMAAAVGIGSIIGMLVVMSWVERRMLGSGAPRREPARSRPRETSRFVAEYRHQRASLNAPTRTHRNALSAVFSVVAVVLAVFSVGYGSMRTPSEVVRSRRPVSVGGPGAMRRPGPRHLFDRPTGRGSRRSRNRAKPRS